MSVLFITQRFPPHGGAAARRLSHLAAGFAENGGVSVIRMGGGQADHPAVVDMATIRGQDLRKLAGQEGKTLSARTKRFPILRWLLRLRQAFPLVYLTDDGGRSYRRQALKAATRMVRDGNIQTVFSSFRPWSDHLVARQLKRQFPDLHWIADFRDLPVDPVRRDIWWPTLQRWWGKYILRQADEVWVVSEGQRVQLASWHANIVVRRNALLVLPPVSSAPKTERFTIVYTGSLYSKLQSIAPLKKALLELLASGQLKAEEVALLYRGKDAPLFREWAEGLPEVVLDIQPSIAPAAAQKMQQTAQVLLLLNWSAPGYYGVLTAKLWDYLGTGRPILSLINGPGDPELEGIIAGAGAGACFRTNEQGEVTRWLATNYAAWQAEKRLPWSVNTKYLNRYTQTSLR